MMIGMLHRPALLRSGVTNLAVLVPVVLVIIVLTAVLLSAVLAVVPALVLVLVLVVVPAQRVVMIIQLLLGRKKHQNLDQDDRDPSPLKILTLQRICRPGLVLTEMYHPQRIM
jgi:hypothetical protein